MGSSIKHILTLQCRLFTNVHTDRREVKNELKMAVINSAVNVVVIKPSN